MEDELYHLFILPLTNYNLTAEYKTLSTLPDELYGINPGLSYLFLCVWTEEKQERDIKVS